MVVKEQTECVSSDLPLPTNDRISLELHGQNDNDKDIQLKEQFAAGDDFAPKVRKPYTITKQRERWTEEEHKKFLEALKLYGRAWRRIEEHVGSKTAVQIRSHAQKFFSKVVRESNVGDGGAVKPIEIPPPRPKRKPVHPYPRKLVIPVKTGIIIPGQPDRSTGKENQSPTSVLSALGSEQSVGADSPMPGGSPSPASSALARSTGNTFGSEAPKFLPEDGISSQSDHEDVNSNTDEEMPLVPDHLSRKSALVEGGPNETATQSLKLFGKTLLVVESSGQSCSTVGTCKPESINKRVETSLFARSVVPLKVPSHTSEEAWRALSNRSLMPVCSSEMKNDLLHVKVPACSGAHYPWLTLHTDASSHSTVEVHSPTPIRAQSMYAKREKLDSDEQKEGSSTDSNTDSTAHGGKVWDTDSCPPAFDRKRKRETSSLSYKLSKRVSASSFNIRRGFVPYKRCFTEQDCTDSSMDTAEERDKQRIRLCL